MASSAPPALSFPLTSVLLDSDAQSCWELAHWIGSQSSDHELRSYAALLIAIVHGTNPLSGWLHRYMRAAGTNLEKIYAACNFQPDQLRDIAARRSEHEMPPWVLSQATSAVNVAKKAVQIQQATGASELSVRHLLGAYFYDVSEPFGNQLNEWGIDRQRDGSALVRQMQERLPDEAAKWIMIHTESLSQQPDLSARDPVLARVSSFSADSPEGDDYLNIEDDVYALSALICSKAVSPPLSIGLFGDWGSGKSFFIRRLQAGVSWISQHARESSRRQRDLAFYKNVVQIEFNAWNYSAGNLWAALVQHILENLRLTKDEPANLFTERVKHLKDQMQLEKQVVDAATLRKDKARETVDKLKTELDQLRAKHDQDVNDLKAVLEQDVLNTVVMDPATATELNGIRQELGLANASASAGDFLGAVEGARRLLGRARALFEYVPPPQRARFFWSSALVLLVPPALAVAVGLVVHKMAPQVTSISAAVTWASVGLGAATRWLRERSHALEEPLSRLERLQTYARQRVEAAQQKNKADAAKLEKDIALAKDEVLAAKAKHEEAVTRLKEIETQLAATSPASVLADFVRERSQSEDYRRHLGLPAVIRQDFENISNMVAQENRQLESFTNLDEETADKDSRINRIVLYIDDLDRCPEGLVIDVLKAVHLLLAFPLFIAVVAVDARWISRCLAQHFPGLLTPDPQAPRNGNATPNDYLEKIFQIPFWLNAPGDEAVRRMMQGLVSKDLVRTATQSGPNVQTPGLVATGRSDQLFQHHQHDGSLEIRSEELECMKTLAPLLGRSPRSLKRFVNVYRLLKAGLPAAEQDSFLVQDAAQQASFQKVLFLLALVNGLPALSDALFEGLAPERSTPAPGSPPSTLVSALSGLSQSDGEIHEQANRLTAWLDKNPQWKQTPLTEFSSWVPRVARYSYHFRRT